MRRLIAVIMIALLSGALHARPLADPAQEARARDLFHELRCMVCQNQSLADSDAPLAEDLRTLVRERIAMGDSDREVKSFLVDRYGEFVLLRPLFAPHTWALWLAPPLVLLLTLAALFLRRRQAQAVDTPPAPLSAEERARLDALLDKERF